MSLAELAEKADVDLAELVEITECHAPPTPRTVHCLAALLEVSRVRLMEMSGLMEPRDAALSEALVRFAANSKSTVPLTEQEEAAYQELGKVLAESTSKD